MMWWGALRGAQRVGLLHVPLVHCFICWTAVRTLTLRSTDNKSGMAADRALEFDLVTPDGVHRTANAATNADLFWALRGAGAASFGVVLSATFRVEPAMPLTLALMSFNTTRASASAFLSLLATHAPAWAADGWGGPMTAGALALVTPTLDVDAAERSMREASTFVSAQGGSVAFTRQGSFYEFYSTHFASDSPAVGFGSAAVVSFRVLPKALHRSDAGRASIEATFGAMLDAGLTPYVLQTAPASYAYDDRDPAQANTVHAAWRDSYWMVGTQASWAWDASLSEREATAALIQEASRNLTALAPDGSMYPNEADPWTEDWQGEFWGRQNYARLLEIKQKYDPDGLLVCWKCVGFESTMQTNEAYQCMGAFQGGKNLGHLGEDIGIVSLLP